MRLVVGIGGKSSPGSAFSIAIGDDRPVLGIRDLAPSGVPAASRAATTMETSEARKRFQEAGAQTVAVLGEYRSWAMLEGLVDCDDSVGLLIFDDAVDYIAGRLSAGADISSAAADWVKASSRLLEAADACRGAVRIFNAAEIAAAPEQFSYHCESEFGVPLSALAMTPPPLEQAVAAFYVSIDDDIRDLAVELAARSSGFADRAEISWRRGEEALIDLRALQEASVENEALRKDGALLKEQLKLVQYKAELYYQQASRKASNTANLGEMAKLSSELAYARHEIAALKQSASWKFSAPLRVASRASKRLFGVRTMVSERRHLAMLRKSKLFDAEWYLQKYPDVAALGIDPARHFLRFGAREGRSPSAKFNLAKYLKAHPDVAASGVNPLIHYLQFGRSEARAAGA